MQTENNEKKQHKKRHRVLLGRVVSNRMQDSIVVRVNFNQLDPRFKKTVRRSKKVMAHDQGNIANIGDLVKIKESNPISKSKHYRLIEVAEKAGEVAGV